MRATPRPDGAVSARLIGEAGHHDVHMRIYVRSPMGKDLPTQREVENKISDLLLAQPRLDEEGVDWDVSATSCLPEEDDETS
jgi:hypothetical protein